MGHVAALPRREEDASKKSPTEVGLEGSLNL
jgi:hypothetical protein